MRVFLTIMFLLLSAIVSAEIVRGIDFDFVTIGNVGNQGDTRVAYPDAATPYGGGAVDYEYRIGKYEITNTQWDQFVSIAGVPVGSPSSGFDEGTFHYDSQQPVTGVSWYEATQFCNYLTSGNKYSGVYQFNQDGVFLGGIDRASAEAAYGTIYFLPTEDEWYKAAYYKPDGSGYSTYANGTNTAPVAGIDSLFSADGPALPPENPWIIGSGTVEQNGTFDMMGNVGEWTETVYSGTQYTTRGGNFGSDAWQLSSMSDWPLGATYEVTYTGFRIATNTIPEPGSLILLGLGGLWLHIRRHGMSFWRVFPSV